jgi:hypothetical protein
MYKIVETPSTIILIILEKGVRKKSSTNRLINLFRND